MIYAAMTFWMLLVVLMAWGGHRLWAGMIKPKVFNTLLLPGTLAAQTGHVLGLLVTGATIRNTTLIKDDESGEPETTPDPEPRIPVIGPVIIAMLPLLACAAGVFLVTKFVANPFSPSLQSAADATLPMSLADVWELLRKLITLAESAVASLRGGDFSDWRYWVSVYLMICLTIRMAPFPGYLRGSLGAIVVLGVGAALITSLLDVADPRVVQGWALLNAVVATLLLLLLASLMVRGTVGLVRVLRSGE